VPILEVEIKVNTKPTIAIAVALVLTAIASTQAQGEWLGYGLSKDTTLSYRGEIQSLVSQDFVTPEVSQFIDSMRNKPQDQQLHDVNIFVNRSIRYQVQDHWRSPRETFLQKSGDCKDFTTAKMALLKELGFKDSDLVLVRGHSRGQPHVLLGVLHHGEWKFLDGYDVPQTEISLLWYFKPSVVIDDMGVRTLIGG
jgi:predicted transglutaminase-like cysteine proteinase